MTSPAADLLVRFAGWYLLDSLWIGMAVAMAYALFERAARRGAPNLRHAVACACLAGVVVLPGMMAAVTIARAPAGAPLAGEYVRLEARDAPETTAPSGRTEAAATIRAGRAVWEGRLRDAAPLVVALWLAGVCAMALRYALVWRTVRRLCRLDTNAPPPELAAMLEEVRRRMGIGRRIELLVSPRADVPMVLGWMRIVLLLPAAVALKMEAAQLEAILAHELAHVRRRDWLVNLLQVFASTLLFHHPAVWWLSGRIAAEREFCCDDLAVRASGGVVPYLRALICLEELRGGAGAAANPDLGSGLALAATGGDRVARARRLTGETSLASQGAPASAVALGLLACGAAGWLLLMAPAAWAQRAAANDLRVLRERNQRVAGRLADEADLRLDTPVTLMADDAPLRNVLQRIGRDAGLQIVYPLEAGLRPVAVAAADEPARDVLDRLLDAQGLVWMYRGDLALQVLPADGSISPGHLLLRAAAGQRDAGDTAGLRGEPSLAALATQLTETRPEALSEASHEAVGRVLPLLREGFPDTLAAVRLIAQVERAPERERDVAMQLEVTGEESNPGEAERWVALACANQQLSSTLVSAPRLQLGRPPRDGAPREFSLLLSLALD